MGRSKQKASSSSRGYTSRNQLAMMINNGVKNAKRIEYDISHETSFYDHYFSYDKKQDQGIEEEIKSDYVPFVTMAVTTNDKNNPFPRVLVDKNNIIDSDYGNHLINSLDDLAIFISNFDDEKKEEKKEEKTQELEFETKTDENAQQMEYWLGWHETSKYDGMHGMLKYGRPDLMLVFVLDISGSMGSPFKESGVEYAVGSRKNTKSMSKIAIAKKVLIKFLDQLQKNDYFGLVVFNSETKIIHDIEQWGNTNIPQIIEKINKLDSGGGTVITTAYNTACKMLLDCPPLQKFEKRLFFLTDMEVSTSEGTEYTKLVSKYATNESVYSSVTGIGLDLSNGVITRLSSTAGCNYSNVLNSDDFVEIINYEFCYMVTPIAMNVKLTILSEHEIVGGFGSFEVRNFSKTANKKQCGQITRFPSQCNYRGERRSGVILLKLKSSDFGKNQIVRLKINYDDVDGQNKEVCFKKDFSKMRVNEAENNGIKKAILLKRHVDFLQFYLKLRLKYNPSQKDIELFTKWNKMKYYQYFEYMVQNLVQLNDASLMEELKILKWVGNHDNIKFSDGIQESINNVRVWDNLFFCPSGTDEKQPALFPNLIKIISNTSEMESLITGFLRDNTYDDAKVSMDILKIIPMYLLPIAFYNKK